MRQRQFRICVSFGLALGLGLAAMQAIAASIEVASNEAQANPVDPAAKPAVSTAPGALIAGNDSGKQEEKKGRLRFRTTDGTCACTCASGGTSEQAIQKSQEARERADR
jgi:hypothetical protein